MSHLVRLSPSDFVGFLREEKIRRFCLVHDLINKHVQSSHQQLQPLADFVFGDARDFAEHEGLFFQVTERYDTLQGAFVHRTCRGQAAGGVRYWTYGSVEDYLRDGLRLAKGMTHKNALAGLWWGGGKGVMARRPDVDSENYEVRKYLYSEYGRFISSLRGCYVTAEDVGTTVADIANVFSRTRFTTCIPEDWGGSGNPSVPTARGVVCAMEAALEFLKRGDLNGKVIAIQGMGNVGGPLIRFLFEKNVRRIIACDINAGLADALRKSYAGLKLDVRTVSCGDESIFPEECDIFSPNATGAILNPRTIPLLKAKIVDFCLAKLTREGMTIGTIAYMSPEQARGEAVDERTDIWSLGVVLYEILSGSMPFKGDYDQTLIHSILHHEPAPITKTRKDLPAGLGDIVAKALQKNPAERYQSMEDLLEDLQAIAEGLKPVRAKSGIFRGRVLGLKKIYVYPIMACLVLLIILAGFFFLPRHPQAFDSIAVLPVENVSGDPEQEAFCYGIHQDLIAQLSSIKAFKKVIDKNTMMTFKGTKKKSSEIAKELKVSAIVTANAVRSGSRVRIRFEVVDGLNNSQIGGDRFDGEYRDILSLEGQAAVAIAQKIQVALTPDEAKAVTQKKPVNPEAHNAYQKDMPMLGKEDISSAIPYFEQALDIDPDFAQAYAGLSLA